MAGGAQLASTATTSTFANKDWGTTYYAWVAAEDTSGNKTVARCTPSSITTAGSDPNTTLVKRAMSWWYLSPGDGTLDISEHTVSFWVKDLTPIETTVFIRPFSFEGGINWARVMLTPTTRVLTYGDSLNSGQNKTIGSIADGAWHHVLVSRQLSTNTLKMAFDGVAIANSMTTGSGASFLASIAKFSMGGYNSGLHVNQNMAIGEF